MNEMERNGAAIPTGKVARGIRSISVAPWPAKRRMVASTTAGNCVGDQPINHE